MPAKGADEAPTTRHIDEWKVGIALPGDATVTQIREAVATVLSDPAFGSEAMRRSVAFEGLDGAALAADSVEAVMGAAG